MACNLKRISDLSNPWSCLAPLKGACVGTPQAHSDDKLVLIAESRELLLEDWKVEGGYGQDGSARGC